MAVARRWPHYWGAVHARRWPSNPPGSGQAGSGVGSSRGASLPPIAGYAARCSWVAVLFFRFLQVWTVPHRRDGAVHGTIGIAPTDISGAGRFTILIGWETG